MLNNSKKKISTTYVTSFPFSSKGTTGSKDPDDDEYPPGYFEHPGRMTTPKTGPLHYPGASQKSRDRKHLHETKLEKEQSNVRKDFASLESGAAYRAKGALKLCKTLLDYDLHPPGSYTVDDFKAAKQVLKEFTREKVTGSAIVNAALQLIDRVLEEQVLYHTITWDSSQPTELQPPAQWLCDPRFSTPILDRWKEAAGSQLPDVWTPKQLLLRIHRWTQLYVYEICLVPRLAHPVILEVAQQQSHPSEAPIVMQELLDIIRRAYHDPDNDDPKPYEADDDSRAASLPIMNVELYNEVLFAWAKSKRPDACDKMNELLDSMRWKDGIMPDGDSYSAFELLDETHKLEP
jgi:hypothetical protein